MNNMQAPPVAPPPPGSGEVDESVWGAVAGHGFHIPGNKSYVYYFPQGHLEQLDASSEANQHNFTLMQPWIPCQVISVHLLSDPVSDQPFAKFVLQPIDARPSNVNSGGGGGGDEDFISFAKILTRSDANNGGGFSVPRICAEMIFPPLNFRKDPPVQNLFMTDTRNITWEFRHIYRGTPRRHLLTTGWSKYVNAKRLIAGDSVVFMRRKSANQLFIGVRRATKYKGSGEGYGGEEVVAEIEKAVRGMAFEVSYYPKIGASNFVVLAEKVKQSLQMRWKAGMRVKMAVETDDSARMTWIHGGVAPVKPPAAGVWFGSPWRMLQVKWDDPEISRNIKKVSPWEVEYTPLSSTIDAGFPAPKRFKLLNDYGMMTTDDVPVKDLSLSSPSISVPEFSHYYPFPAGMQGARPGKTATNAAASSSSVAGDDQEELIGVSTALTIGGSNLEVGPPSDGQPSSSFQLFGIKITKPAAPENGECGSD